MDGNRLAALIYKGRGIAATHIGLACAVYRPISASAPFNNQIATLDAAFNAKDPSYKKANLYGNAVWYADLDGRVTQAGDYLVRTSDANTWFICAQQPLLPIAAVECNRSIRISRAVGITGVGAQGYSSIAQKTDVLGTQSMDSNQITFDSTQVSFDGSRWPCSILSGTGRAIPGVGLPGDVKEGGVMILLPPSVPIVIESSDSVIDDLGRTFAIEAAELTDLGWRLSANETHG